MEYISKAEDWVIKLYPEENEVTNYKLSDYVIIVPYNNGYILFHTITWSMYFLSQEEYNNIISNSLLIKNKIIIPDNINEKEIAKKVYLERATTKIDPYKTIKEFVIFPTNECNANCFYCYEKNKKGVMSIETAQKVVKFIKKHSYGKIKISWFGGEPLKNTPIIDYISDELQKENIDFTSLITTNGSLFNKDLIKKAENNWKVTNLFITIDGPEKIYNKFKNYENFTINPFETVINNINDILEYTKIPIHIRINLEKENIDYVDELITYLDENLKPYNDNQCDCFFKLVYQISDDIDFLKKENILEKYKRLKNKYIPKEIIKKHDLINCMVDSCQGIAITPDGTLHNCEHNSDMNKIGTLDTDITEKNIIAKSRNKDTKSLEFCFNNKCKLLPICERFDSCETNPRCTKISLMEFENQEFFEKLKNTADYYFQKLAEINEKKGEE